MTTIIRGDRRRTAAAVVGMLAIVVLALALAWVVMVIWTIGGPQPVHRIVIAIPAPQLSAPAGRPA